MYSDYVISEVARRQVWGVADDSPAFCKNKRYKRYQVVNSSILYDSGGSRHEVESTTKTRYHFSFCAYAL
jgi:hypothetical protein